MLSPGSDKIYLRDIIIHLVHASVRLPLLCYVIEQNYATKTVLKQEKSRVYLFSGFCLLFIFAGNPEGVVTKTTQ